MMLNMMDKQSNMDHPHLPIGMKSIYLFWYDCMEARITLSIDEFFHSFMNLHAHRIDTSIIKVALQIIYTQSRVFYKVYVSL